MLSSDFQKRRRLRIWVGLALGLIFLAVYVYFYIDNSIPSRVSDLVTSAMTPVAAIIAAVMGTLVLRNYGKGTPPRLIWLYFTLALWGWAIAETIWLAEYLIGGEEMARLGPADIFWVASYFLFIVSLYRQYTLIYRPQKRTALAFVFFSVAAVLLFTYLYGTWLLASSPDAPRLETFVNAFYAMGDLALSIGALIIAFSFRQGALSRPWLGLLVFTFADLLYAWLQSSGMYAWSTQQGNFLSTLSDTLYFAAYLVIAFGCYLQLILLSYGPRLKYDQ